MRLARCYSSPQPPHENRRQAINVTPHQVDRALDLAERWVANEERREARLAAAQHESGKRKGAAVRAAALPAKPPKPAEPTPEQLEIRRRREAARAELPQ